MDSEFSKVPDELKNLSQWVCWRYEERNGKETKVPICATTGVEADCTDPDVFNSFGTALARFRKYNNLDGIGFVFADSDPFTGIDIDDCLENGSFTETATGILKRFPGTYAEVSPSRTGVKLWLRGSLPIPPNMTGRKNPKRGIETYCRGRYFTVTGNRLDDSRAVIVDHNEKLQQWFSDVFGTAKTDGKTDKTPALPVSANVQQIVSKASASRNGDRFQRLWSGDCSDYGDDQSSADLGLCSQLAFWCGGNANLIDECFRGSGLMRPKWDREDYRAGTIKKAIDSCREFYDWDRQSGLSSVLSSSSAKSDFARVAQNETSHDPWPELIPITGPEPEPILPTDFPDCITPIVQAVTESLEVPAELPALMILGVLATASQKKFEIASDGSHREPLSLFTCPAMPPGERKTAVVAIVTRPLRRWEMELRAKLAPEIRENESHRQTALRRIEVLRSKAAKSDDPDERHALQSDINAIEAELPPAKSMPVLLIEDCSVEHVATMLSRQNEKLSIMTDEGGIFDIIGGRYSKGVPNLDVFLQAHAGSPVRVNRGSREPVDLHSPCLTVAVSCQPYVLQEIGANKAFRGRGLLARFLFAVPKSRLGFRTLRPQEIESTILDHWAMIVSAMLDQDQQFDEYGNPVARTLYLTRAAYRTWKSEQCANEIEMRPGGPWASDTGWASKYPGAVLRIAGVLHCAVCAECRRDPADVDVAEITMRSAVTIGQKIKAHTLQAFGMMALSEDQKFAARIVEWIRRENVREFTGRECSIHCNSAGSMKELEGAFDLLLDRGWIRQAGTKKPKGRGRPSHPFEVNPAVAMCDDKNDKNQSDDGSGGISSFLSSSFALPVLRP